MDSFQLITLGVWVLIGSKLVYDQMWLFKVYRRDVEKHFELSPFTKDFTVRNPIVLTKKRLEIIYGHYPKHPEVDRCARRVRIDVVLAAILFIVFATWNFITI
jgi:hypothetical protein